MLRHAASMLPVALRASLRERSLVSRVQRRVHITECDFNRHMNQAAYARVAELARMDWLMVAGILGRLWKAKVKPIMAEQRLVYRRELAPGQRYAIDTRATGFDARLLLVEAHVLVDERVHTAIYGKLLLIGPQGVLSADEARALLEPIVTDALVVENWSIVPERSG